MSVVDEGLGNSTYLLDLGDGRALAVDAPRDLRAVRQAAARRGLTIVYAADTHLHADFLSGAVQLAAIDGAQILASAAGNRRFEHRGLRDGDEIDLGGLTLQAWATPGHTDEHLSFVVKDGSRPLGVFSGGSLIVGSAARTDLLGDDRTIELAHAQYASLQRLATLPDATALWPTHGAGSFCSAPSGSARTSTIGAEKAGNALLSAPDAGTFTRLLTAPLGSYPDYFRWLSEANRIGAPVIKSEPVLATLIVDEVRALMASGAAVIDVRPIADVAKGHLPGAVSIALRPQFATWLGWVINPDTPLIIVRNGNQHPADILWPAYNIGYTNFLGELAGGVDAWTSAGHSLVTAALTAPGSVGGRVLDVRQDSEYVTGHLPEAIHIQLGELTEDAADMGTGPVTVMCGHGERAMTAATLLQRQGHSQVSVLDGGVKDWAAATGNRPERGV
ncbi:MAG TPA: MBL fold metallo-hydrolase [Micromonosporaceae bacterium]|nr:MBL fold metallo-hydrolase [Micromonosporaceae bacterium]